MNFFWLKNPYYDSDQADNAANSVREINEILMPGIICSACGSTWAGNRKLYLHLPESSLWSQLHGGVLPENEWKKLEHNVRLAANLSENFSLRPGDQLNIPTYEIRRPKLRDFIHPFPGTIIINSRVVQALQDANLTGYEAIRIITQPKPYLISDDFELFALKVNGCAWHTDVSIATITVCDKCGRHKPPMLDWHILDEQRWDKDDFVYVDCNPNRIVVTERVCELLTRGNFTNWCCE